MKDGRELKYIIRDLEPGQQGKKMFEIWEALVKESLGDGYWMKMGDLALDAISCLLRSDLTTQQEVSLMRFIGELMGDAYKMGMRMEQFKTQIQYRETLREGSVFKS